MSYSYLDTLHFIKNRQEEIQEEAEEKEKEARLAAIEKQKQERLWILEQQRLAEERKREEEFKKIEEEQKKEEEKWLKRRKAMNLKKPPLPPRPRTSQPIQEYPESANPFDYVPFAKVPTLLTDDQKKAFGKRKRRKIKVKGRFAYLKVRGVSRKYKVYTDKKTKRKFIRRKGRKVYVTKKRSTKSRRRVRKA